MSGDDTITIIDPDDPIFEALDQLTAPERLALAKVTFEAQADATVDLTIPDFLVRKGGAR